MSISRCPQIACTLLFAFLLAGCGGTSGDSLPDVSNNGGAPNNDDRPTEFSFLEDQDPVVADLPYVDNELITHTLPGADPACIADAVQQLGATTDTNLAAINTAIVRVAPGRLLETAAALADSPLVEGVHKNYLFAAERAPDDPGFVAQEYLSAIRIETAWDISTGSEDIVLAILDTGVETDHPDLADRLRAGWNTYDENANAADVAGHGTGVAGVAAAIANNQEGIAGANWISPVIPVRVTNADGLASANDIAEGMIWAVDHGARIINVSFAPLHSDSTVLRAAQYVRNAGGLVFISAGNDGLSSNATGDDAALFIAATNTEGLRASFSTSGPFVDLAAPGTAMRTTATGAGYGTVSGTSFSSPLAAGVASLVWSVKPQLSPAAVAGILIDTAIDAGAPGKDSQYGAGVLDAAAAVARARSLSADVDTTEPTAMIDSPMNGADVADVVTVEVTADDDNGIAEVVLYVDGEPFATDALAPYRFAWDSAAVDPGMHTITCVATDRAGNTSADDTIEVAVGPSLETGRCVAGEEDPVGPDITVNHPLDGAIVGASVGIRATATDNVGLAGLTLYVDGVLIQSQSASGTSAVVDFVWNTSDYALGTHQIIVRATDDSGNMAEARVTLTKG